MSELPSAGGPTPPQCEDARRFVLTLVLVAVLALALLALFLVPIPKDAHDLILAVLSVGVLAPLKDCYGWWVGSSSGSSSKDATIAAMASKDSQPGAGQ